MPGADHRVLVVGGGPAGLATAIRARQRGFEVRVVDRARPPVDKACGEGLMPDGVARLRQLGVDPQAWEHRSFRGIRYLDGQIVAEAVFPAEPGLGVRRTHLHRALAARAEALGAEILWGVRAETLHRRGVMTSRGLLEADWVVAADGLHSRLRRWAGLAGRPARRPRFGIRRHYTVAPWSDHVEVHWAEGAEAYVTPVGPREVGVALLWSGGKARFDTLLDRFPSLRQRLASAPAASRDRGAGPLHQRVRGVERGRLALVGDAAGYLDAITGEGLALAFHQAFALVEALERGDLGRYARACRRLRRLPDALTRLLLLAERHPRLRARAMRALAADPALFARLLALHVRALPPRALGLSEVLGWLLKLVTA